MKENKVYPVVELFEVEELNEIVSIYNVGDINIQELIGRIWNKAFSMGLKEGYLSSVYTKTCS